MEIILTVPATIEGEILNKGLDAKINGLNTLTIDTGEGLTSSQIGSTFSIAVDEDYINTATQSALDLKANDNAVVHLGETETITGAKTFTLPTYFQKGSVDWKIDLSTASGYETSLAFYYYNSGTETWIEKSRIDI